MTHQPALAVLRDALNLRLEELNTAIKKHGGKNRDDPAYAETYLARENAYEAYNQAFEVWNEEAEKEPA